MALFWIGGAIARANEYTGKVTEVMHRIGKVLDMKALYNDGSVAEVDADEAQHVIRHSAAHIMAQAIKRLYPEADFAYGPATDNGVFISLI